MSYRKLKPKEVVVGLKVRYHSVIDEEHDGKIYTVTHVGYIDSKDKEPVVWLEGKAGCVAVEALSKAEDE